MPLYYSDTTSEERRRGLGVCVVSIVVTFLGTFLIVYLVRLTKK